MTVALYADVNVEAAIVRAVRRGGHSILTAVEDGLGEADDAVVLDRATALGRAVFTRDADFLRLDRARQRDGVAFGGVIYAQQRDVTVSRCIADLLIIVQTLREDEMKDAIFFLPL